MKPGDIIDGKVQGILQRKNTKVGRKATIRSVGTDDIRDRWWYPAPPESLTKEQKKKVLGCVIQQMVLCVFSSHFYEWNGEIFKQEDGGPQGLRSTQPVSRIIMDFWVKEILELQDISRTLHKHKPIMYGELSIQMLIKYVDDCLVALYKMRRGVI